MKRVPLMGLAVWQKRLESHFTELRRQRSSKEGGTPLFALEHGLSESELRELHAHVREDIANSSPKCSHSLPWIVYATEIGYQYAGDEYWQTFESRTPGWTTFGDRYWIRKCFLDFHIRYGGAKPSGLWARHFSIICWPITHAILPRDLQRQLAKILYELRYTFDSELFDSPILLGEQIAARSWNSTSRFQNFAQEPLLVGQIAAALLLQGEHRSQSLILSQTLNRIVKDLDRERQARHWLRGAQKHAGQLHFRGLARESAKKTEPRVERDSWREQITALALEPRLMLRPNSPSLWDVLIEIPDLSPLLPRFPNLRSVLTDSRCSVAGSVRRSPRARGTFLHGPQRDILKQWPKSDEVLLQFEQSSPELEGLLSTDCLLRPGPIWLFRIGVDEWAYEIRSKVVRPGQSYILISSIGPTLFASLGKTLSLSCAGVCAARLDIPSVISSEWQDFIDNVGLSLSRSIQVWPVGLPPVAWDGEGRGEWISTDPPRIGVRADHAIDGITLRIKGNESNTIDLAPPESGAPVFVELPFLSPGVHVLHISTRSSRPEFDGQAGQLELAIREPRPWSSGLSHKSPLMVVVDPATPSLENLWEGLVEIEVHGPIDRQITCYVKLLNRLSATPITIETLPKLTLPVDSSTWRSHFERHFQNHDKVRSLCELAHACQIDFYGEELGTFSLKCEREFTPLRWAIQKKGREHTLTLIDDTGSEQSVEVERYDFRSPDAPVKLELLSIAQGLKVPESGGMFVATVAQYQRAIILPPQVRTIRPSELKVETNFNRRTCSLEEISEIVALIELWSRARIPGDIFALYRQRNVLIDFIQYLFSILCGMKWARVEDLLRARGQGELIKRLSRTISSHPQMRSLGVILERDYAELSGQPITYRISRLSSLSRNFLVPPKTKRIIKTEREGTAISCQEVWGSEWLSEFALRLASCPDNIRSWSGSNFAIGLETLIEVPTLARAARFLVLAIDGHLQKESVGGRQLYKGWTWG